MTDRSFPETWAALERLAARPLVLWMALLAANTIFQPYEGMIHDARLYAGQTMNRIDPAVYQNDLFFRYGSQDKFSAFSVVAAPLVRFAGTHVGFALLYLVGNGLFLFGVQRLCLRLVPQPAVAVIAAAYLAVVQVPFAGLDVFNVNENFLTPRLFANGLVLLALERALARKWPTAGALLLGGAAFHPLMAVGGILLVAGLFALRWLTPWRLVAIAALPCLIGAYVLATPALGIKFLGEFDAEWRDLVHRANPYNFTDSWEPDDWVRLFGAVGLVAAARRVLPDRGDALAGLTLLLAAVALFGNFVAERFPYAILMQGQPYRSLWLVQLLSVPFGFAAAAHWATQPNRGRQMFAAGCAIWLIANSYGPAIWIGAGLFAAVFATLRWNRWPFAGAVGGASLAAMLGSLVLMLIVALNWSQLMIGAGPVDHYRAAINLIPLPLALFGAMAICVVFERGGWHRTVGLAALAVAITLALYVLPLANWHRERTPGDRSAAFVRQHIDAKFPGDRRPCIYWAGGPIQTIWLDLSATSYFSWAQINGNVFNRQNAVEGRRRAVLCRPFELDETFRKQPFQPTVWRTAQLELLEAEPNVLATEPPKPTFEDLVRLSADPAVDWIVLEVEIPDAKPATDGFVYVYDARKLRSR